METDPKWSIINNTVLGNEIKIEPPDIVHQSKLVRPTTLPLVYHRSMYTYFISYFVF
jgi:hypothetical protein